jgi:lipoteichoic acid synthase
MGARTPSAIRRATVEATLPVTVAVTAWALLVGTGLQLFAETGWPPHRAVASASAATLFAVLAPLAALPPRLRLPLAGWLLIVSTLLTLLDRLAWRHYQDVLSVADWPAAANVLPVAASAAALTTRTDAWLLVPAIGGLLALVWRSPVGSAGRCRPYAAMVLVAAGIVAAAPAVSLVARDPDGVFEFSFQRRELVDTLGLPGYHTYDLFEHGARRWTRWRATSTVPLEPPPTLAEATPSRHPLWGAAAGANLILVSLESVQQFAVGLTLNGQAVAPHLTALSRESLAFTRALDQTHRGSTADAEWLALQSLYPLEAGAVASRAGRLDLRALPAVLAAEGYTTRSAAAQPPGYWNMGRFHARLGFSESWFADRFEPMPWIGLGGADVRFFEVMERRLADLPEPFMAYLLTSSSHHPFELPREARLLRLGGLRDTTLGNYLQAVHYTDRALGGFIEALRRSGRLERSLLVVYGDHSAALDLAPHEERLLASQLPALRNADSRFRRWWLRSRIPLLIRLPAAVATGERLHPTGLVDLAPTVLPLLGVSSPPGLSGWGGTRSTMGQGSLCSPGPAPWPITMACWCVRRGMCAFRGTASPSAARGSPRFERRRNGRSASPTG